MPRLFSYGSLQQPAVQLEILGRSLAGTADEIVGFERVLIRRGAKQLSNVIRNGRADARVAGTVFEIADAELAVVDAYEAGDSYVRTPAALATGGEAWLYAEAALQIQGSCHCANISYSLEWPGAAAEIPARSCGCTFCLKHGGVWTSHPQAVLRVWITAPDVVTRYAFGTGTAQFLVCTRCGVAPVVTSQIDGAIYAVVNVNTFDNVERSRILCQPANFEGEEVSLRLERRRRKWIADVVVTEGRS